jgi:hypothetical protein
MIQPADAARSALTLPWSSDRAVTRVTIHAIATAASGSDAEFMFSPNWLSRSERRGDVKLGRFLIQVFDRRAFRQGGIERPSDTALLAAAVAIEQAADDDANAMVAPRLRAEAQLLRDLGEDVTGKSA